MLAGKGPSRPRREVLGSAWAAPWLWTHVCWGVCVKWGPGEGVTLGKGHTPCGLGLSPVEPPVVLLP